MILFTLSKLYPMKHPYFYSMPTILPTCLPSYVERTHHKFMVFFKFTFWERWNVYEGPAGKYFTILHTLSIVNEECSRQFFAGRAKGSECVYACGYVCVVGTDRTNTVKKEKKECFLVISPEQDMNTRPEV